MMVQYQTVQIAENNMHKKSDYIFSNLRIHNLFRTISTNYLNKRKSIYRVGRRREELKESKSRVILEV
nr:MAG TPA: hypothetical protein [Caudoviricetes sp.]